jgi:hypothetical protein
MLLHEQVMTHKSISINYGSIYGIFHDSVRKEDVILKVASARYSTF